MFQTTSRYNHHFPDLDYRNSVLTLNACRLAAQAGALRIQGCKSSRAWEKADPTVGHHAISSEADHLSQEKILLTLSQCDRDPTVRFLVEEDPRPRKVAHSVRQRILSRETIVQMRSAKVYIADELDGTSSYKFRHYEWSTSLGCVERGIHTAGAVCAPKIESGLTFTASLGRGAFMERHDSWGDRQPLKTRTRESMKDAYIIFGPDCLLSKYPRHQILMHSLSDDCTTGNINGSCALALCLVAAGRANALVQPLQSPWDWAAGKLIVEEAGGAMIFYEMNEGNIEEVQKLEPRHYDPSVRGVAFIAAGDMKLARAIFDRLRSIKHRL